MIQIINKIGGSMTVKILNMIKTIAVIYVITAIILLGLSFGLYKFNLSEWQIKAGIIITYIISSAVGGFMIGSRQKNKRLLWGALTGFLYFMILALISFIVGNVDEINIYDMIKTALICVTSGCAGSFFSSLSAAAIIASISSLFLIVDIFFIFLSFANSRNTLTDNVSNFAFI